MKQDNAMEKTLEDYLRLPYTRELIPEPEGGWFVRIKELPGCMSQGETPVEAMNMIEDAMAGWIESALAHGTPIPEPRGDEAFSGKFVVRVPKSMHRKLADSAEEDGVSLNQWIVAALSEAVGSCGIESNSAWKFRKFVKNINLNISDVDEQHYAQLTTIIRDWAEENRYQVSDLQE